MRKLRFLSVLLLLGVHLSSAAQLYTFRNYNHRDGLHTVAVKSMDQSDDGFIWIGTEGTPLVRFDGNEFVEMRGKGQDFEHHIAHLDYERDTVFFASQYKGFYCYVPKNNTYKKFKTNIDNAGEALAFLHAGTRKYGIASRKIISIRNKNASVLFEFEKSVELYHHYILNDRVFIFTSSGNYVIKENKVQSLHSVLNVAKSKANQYHFGHALRNKLMLCDSKGTEWLEVGIRTDGSLFKQRSFQRNSVLAPNEVIISYYQDTRQANSTCSFQQR